MRRLVKWTLIAIVILALLLVAVYGFFIGYRYWTMTYSDPAEKQAYLAYSKEKVATVILNDRLAPKDEITVFTQAEALSHLQGMNALTTFRVRSVIMINIQIKEAGTVPAPKAGII
ncbi:Uncharacterised protein [Serratia ficaria]|uniref:hypothetical protein n=1 Tax=Enterobacterales TaxID=91347 RepID=UPI000F7E1EB0|nr:MULTISPECIES: hypothetical protein [Enterobacterales]RSV89039.1 hypothetical protein EGH55_20365 [Klebsiella aerogenes]CAI1805443.1 Uncharacterised protein [Serratia ficaria]